VGTFRYTATDERARVVQGTVDADDERAGIERLRERRLYPIRLEAAGAGPAGIRRLLRLGGRPTRQEVLLFTQQLHVLLEAGLEVDRGLAILAELAAPGRLEPVIRVVLTDVQAGLSLADSLAKHPRVFSRLYVNMVKAGEAGGVLELVLRRLAAFLESERAIRSEVLSAGLYPSLVMAIGVGSVVFLLNFVVPRFSWLFSEAGHSLPWSTRLLLGVSGFTASYWWLIALGLTMAWLGARGYLETETGRVRWDHVKLRAPLVGKLIRELEVGRFARTAGTLLQSGVPILTVLRIVSETVGNAAVAAALPHVHERVRRGEGLARPLRECGVFPPLAVHLARVGEETGRLEEMLLRVADVYDERVKTSLRRLLSLLEPVMILGLGIVVGFIVLSMLLAIFTISDLPT
jgi:type II secretory pathway component PulF